MHQFPCVANLFMSTNFFPPKNNSFFSTHTKHSLSITKKGSFHCNFIQTHQLRSAKIIKNKITLDKNGIQRNVYFINANKKIAAFWNLHSYILRYNSEDMTYRVLVMIGVLYFSVLVHIYMLFLFLS